MRTGLTLSARRGKVAALSSKHLVIMLGQHSIRTIRATGCLFGKQDFREGNT
jgi:hypothetical protein